MIAVCERLPITAVATMGQRNFANVRPRHAAAVLTIVPLRMLPLSWHQRG